MRYIQTHTGNHEQHNNSDEYHSDPKQIKPQISNSSNSHETRNYNKRRNIGEIESDLLVHGLAFGLKKGVWIELVGPERLELVLELGDPILTVGDSLRRCRLRQRPRSGRLRRRHHNLQSLSVCLSVFLFFLWDIVRRRQRKWARSSGRVDKDRWISGSLSLWEDDVSVLTVKS